MVKIHAWNDEPLVKNVSIYNDYSEHPYCSPARDLVSYSASLDGYMLPFTPVRREVMERLPNGLLLGHIKVLWRISLNYFSSKTRIPSYFEYEYGIDAVQEIQTLIDKELVYAISGKDTLDLLTVKQLKAILVSKELSSPTKKLDIIDKILSIISEKEILSLNTACKYFLTESGLAEYKKYSKWLWAFDKSSYYHNKYFKIYTGKDIVNLIENNLTEYAIEKKLIHNLIEECLKCNQFGLLRNAYLDLFRLEKGVDFDKSFLSLMFVVAFDLSQLHNSSYTIENCELTDVSPSKTSQCVYLPNGILDEIKKQSHEIDIDFLESAFLTVWNKYKEIWEHSSIDTYEKYINKFHSLI